MSNIIERLIAAQRELADHPNARWTQDIYTTVCSAKGEIERQRERILDYDSQWSQIAAVAGGDARHCKELPRTISGFVCEEIRRLRKERDEAREKARSLLRYLTGGRRLSECDGVPWLEEETK